MKVGVAGKSQAIPWHQHWDLASPIIQSLVPAHFGVNHLPSLGFSFPSDKIGIDAGVAKVLPARMTTSMGADSWGPLGNLCLGQSPAGIRFPPTIVELWTGGLRLWPTEGAAAPQYLVGLSASLSRLLKLRSSWVCPAVRCLPIRQILPSTALVTTVSTGLGCPVL